MMDGRGPLRSPTLETSREAPPLREVALRALPQGARLGRGQPRSVEALEGAVRVQESPIRIEQGDALAHLVEGPAHARQILRAAAVSAARQRGAKAGPRVREQSAHRREHFTG